MKHYHRPQLLENILKKIVENGYALDHLDRAMLSQLDEFHLQGAKISDLLAKKLSISQGSLILDIGCGIGGPARMLAQEYQCKVVGLDYTAEYVRTATGLSKLVGLEESTQFVHGNATELPFPDHHFDMVWTQHAQMNIQDKAKLYDEIYRVLKKGGSFLYYDIFSGKKVSELQFPVPWAEAPEDSFLMPPEAIEYYCPASLWQPTLREAHTSNAIHALKLLFKHTPPDNKPKLGLNLLMGPSMPQKMKHLWYALQNDQVVVEAGILIKK